MADRRSLGLYAAGAALLGGGLLLGSFGARSLAPTLPSLPPVSSSVTVMRPTAGVLSKSRT